jgi:hypothetical protein
MLKTIRSSLLAQAIAFVLVFSVFYLVESRSYSESTYFETLLAYFIWLPVFWDGIPGGFLTYILLAFVAIVSLALSSRDTLRPWALPLFNVTALLWTLFPWLTYQLGDYRGP